MVLITPMYPVVGKILRATFTEDNTTVNFVLKLI